MALGAIIVVSALFFILFLIVYHCIIRYRSPHSDDGIYFDRDHLRNLRAAIDLQIENEQDEGGQIQAVNRYNVIMAGVLEKKIIPARNKEKMLKRSSVPLANIMFFKMRSKRNLTSDSGETSEGELENDLEDEETTYKSERKDKRNSLFLKDDIEVAEYDNFTRSFRNSLKSSMVESFKTVKTDKSTNSSKSIALKTDKTINSPKSIASKSIRSSSTKSMYKIDTCFICLEKYKVGESIFWSKNDNCDHCFHSKCATRWLFDNDDCPLCRENFICKTSS